MAYNKSNFQKNTNLVKSASFAGQHPPVNRTKTDGRIGSSTPPSMLKGGFTVDKNSKAQPHTGGRIGAKAESHMGPAHEGGNVFSPRVAKARSMAKPNPKPYANPINHGSATMKKVKPS